MKKNHAIRGVCLFAGLLLTLLGARPMPVEAQVPGNFHTPPNLEDFTRGTVDPCGITYELAYSPLVVPLELQDTEVGCSFPLTQDRDADGFWDQIGRVGCFSSEMTRSRP